MFLRKYWRVLSSLTLYAWTQGECVAHSLSGHALKRVASKQAKRQLVVHGEGALKKRC